MSFVNVDEYPLELIPLDSDVLSLEMESSFKVSKLNPDNTKLFQNDVLFTNDTGKLRNRNSKCSY